MRSSRKILWMVLIGAAVLSALGAFHFLRAPRVVLPALQEYANFPGAFRQRLREQRAVVEERPDQADALRKLAQLYEANDLNAEAVFCYRALAKTDQGLSAQDHYCLADIDQSAGDLTAAEAELNEVIRGDSKYLPARIKLGDILFKTGQSAQAEGQYKAALAMEADQPQAAFGLARIELQQKREADAAKRLEALLTRHPDATAGAALLAQISGRQGNVDRAKALIQASRQRPEPSLSDPWLEAISTNCFNLQKLALMFENFSNEGALDRALPLLARFEELDPSSWIPQLLRGWSEDQAQHLQAAEAAYRQALQKGAPAEKVIPLLASCLIKRGALSEADQLAKECSNKNPDSVALLTLYTDVTLRQNNVPLSLTLLRELLKRDPYLYWANLNLAKLLWTAGHHDEAVDCLQRMAAVYPGDIMSRGWLGQYYLEKDQPPLAIAPLRQAIDASQPDSADKPKLSGMLYIAYIQAANGAVGRDQMNQAEEYFDAAMQLDSTELAAYIGKASLYVRLKQFADAAELLKKMQVLQPDNPTIFLSLGDVFYQDGHPDLARQQWEKAVPLTDPSNKALQTALTERLNGPITPQTFQ